MTRFVVTAVSFLFLQACATAERPQVDPVAMYNKGMEEGNKSILEEVKSNLKQKGAYGHVEPYYPVRLPPDIRKVWIVDHPNEAGDLIQGHWVFMVVRPGRWVSPSIPPVHPESGENTSSHIPIIEEKPRLRPPVRAKGMILKANDFHFPDALRAKYFPLVIRASPPEGWPRGTVMVSKNKLPYRCFLQVIGASPAKEFEAEIGDYQDGDPIITLSMLEEIALNCPLREDEAASIRIEYKTTCTEAGEERPPLFIQGLVSPIFYAFESGLLSFSSALVLSLYTNGEVQREIIGLGLIDHSPEVVLEIFTNPFYPGDILNRLAQEPGKLRALGSENFKDFLNEHSPFSYGRSRFLMRLAAVIPAQNRSGLTSDHGELLLSIGKARREALFRSDRISLDGRTLDLKEILRLSRVETRRLIRKAREEKGGAKA